MPTVFIKTYGCQMNERDSEQVGRMFVERGYTMTPREDDADVILINTCSVRDQAEQKAVGKMGMMGRHRKQRPHMVFGFMGCMAQSRGEELFGAIPHLDLVVGTQKYHKVVEHVDAVIKAREEAEMDDLRFAITDVGEEAGSQNTIRDHELAPGQGAAFVSIMQGCNMKCSFCIVPYTRGAERSRPIAEIAAEVRGLVERGVKEVTLLGQIVNLYGRTEFPAWMERARSCSCSRRCMRWTGWSASASPRRTRLATGGIWSRPSLTCRNFARTSISRCKAAATVCSSSCGDRTRRRNSWRFARA